MRPARLLPASLAAALLCSAGGAQAPGAQDVIMLGAAISLSGKEALNGATVKQGYELAIRTINGQGGVDIGGKHYKLAVKYYDDQSIPVRGTELAGRLIEHEGIKFMLGPYGSSQTRAILPVVERNKVPMVQANGEARDLFTRGYRYHFAVLTTSDQLLVPAIQFAAARARKLGKTKKTLRVALATENEGLAQDVRAGALDAIVLHGMNVVIDDQLPPELDDMSFTLTQVKALKPDLLLISGREQGALTAGAQLKELAVEVPVIAMTHCDSARLAEKLGAAVEKILCTHQWHRSLGHRDALFGTAEDFAQEFERAHQTEPPDHAAQSAAAVQVFADAFRRARSLDPAAVRDAIAATEIQTFYGPIKFDAMGRNIAKGLVLTQIQNGKHVVFAPAEWATGSPMVPQSP